MLGGCVGLHGCVGFGCFRRVVFWGGGSVSKGMILVSALYEKSERSTLPALSTSPPFFSFSDGSRGRGFGGVSLGVLIGAFTYTLQQKRQEKELIPASVIYEGVVFAFLSPPCPTAAISAISPISSEWHFLLF